MKKIDPKGITSGLMGNEIIELARTDQDGSDEAREIVRAAVDDDEEAKLMLAGYMSLAKDYVEKGQI